MNPHPLLTLRRCSNCRYAIHPGYDHEIVPQEGKSHAVCKLIKPECLGQFGKCLVCGLWCTRTFRADNNETILTEHHGSGGHFIDADHHANPVGAPLTMILDAYLNHKNGPPE